jgi:hypothetical protein
MTNAAETTRADGPRSREFATPNPQAAAHAILSLGIDVGSMLRSDRRVDAARRRATSGDHHAQVALRMVGAR